jgi:hypothetical protein
VSLCSTLQRTIENNREQQRHNKESYKQSTTYNKVILDKLPMSMYIEFMH